MTIKLKITAISEIIAMITPFTILSPEYLVTANTVIKIITALSKIYEIYKPKNRKTLELSP